MLTLQTETASSSTALNNVLSHPFAWGGVFLAVGVPVFLGLYLLTGPDENERQTIKTYASIGLALAAFLVFTFLFRQGKIKTDAYTSLLAFAFGSGAGYKVHDLGHRKGKDAAMEMGREFAAQYRQPPDDARPAGDGTTGPDDGSPGDNQGEATGESESGQQGAGTKAGDGQTEVDDRGTTDEQGDSADDDG